MSCAKHDLLGERPHTSISVNGSTFTDVCLECANEKLEGMRYVSESTLEELQQTVTSQTTRIARVKRAYAAVERLTEEHRITGENLKQGKAELDLAVCDLDNKQEMLPLGERELPSDKPLKAAEGDETTVTTRPGSKAPKTTLKAPVTTEGYEVGQRVAHEKRKGEFEVTELIDARHLRVKPLQGKSQTPVKVNVANLRPIVDATAAATA